jgi:hypothetical protein
MFVPPGGGPPLHRQQDRVAGNPRMRENFQFEWSPGRLSPKDSLRRASRLRNPCLIDPEIDESGFQQWRRDFVRVATLDQIAQDVISLDGRALA